jgi:hypothetical protein
MYEPKTKSNFVRGDSGVAKVRFSTDKKKVQVLLSREDGSTKEFRLDSEDCPANLVAGEWVVNMTGQGDKMLSFRPVNGHFVFKVKAFASQEGKEPEPKVKDVSFVKDGKKQEYSYEYFTVLLTILSPDKYDGMDVPYVLRYHFQEDTYEGKPVVAYSKGGSKYTNALKEFLAITGAWELGPMPYKDNILPDLQKRILHADRTFEGTLKDGWIIDGSLIAMAEPDETDVPFDGENSRFKEAAGDEIDFEPDISEPEGFE